MRIASRLAPSLALLILLPLAPALGGEYVWIEGEKPAKHTFIKHNWYDKVRKDVLSGGDWLSHYHKEKSGQASYQFEIRKGGEYTVWLRCNWFRVQMDWRTGRDMWKPIDFSGARDKLMISPKPDHRFIGWVKLGKMALAPGKHSVDFRIYSDLANHGGIDAICLVDFPFVPSGVRKPEEPGPAKPSDWFPVVVDDDPFSKESVIDMSGLLPKPAGRYGFLKRNADGLKFENAEGAARFWGCGANVDPRMSRERQSSRARYLAKHGVNMVRQHSVFGFLGPLKNGRFDARKLDDLDWWFAELKKNGIYSTWSVFYPLVIDAKSGYPPELFAELEKGKTSGFVNMSRRLQDLQLVYVRKLLEHKNPHTGLAYRDDPALAVLEVHNEDCIFWHFPLNLLASGKKPAHAKVLRKAFCAWAKRRYATDAELQKAWGTKESLADGELKIYGAWQMKGEKRDRRMGDFIRFLTEMQRGYYARREGEYRSIGFKGVTVTTAWRAGGPAADPANLYCDTAMDMIDRHNYFGGGTGGHGIAKGEVRNGTHLARPGSGILSSGLYQVEDRPFCMTEWTQSPPNQWKAEIAPLVAFYGMGLQGWDASYHFLNTHARLGDGWPGNRSYATDTPHYIGQFPALAFAVHKGHVKQAPIAAARRLKPDQLFTGLDPLKQDFTGGDWDHKLLKKTLETPVEVLAIGRVTVSFDGGKSARTDWAKHWDREKGTVRSATGELVWDSKKRVVTLRGPKTEAVIGFAGGGKFDLPGAQLEVKTGFVSIILTPLDDLALAESRQILVTAMARDRQEGATYSQDGKQLTRLGGPPLLMEPVEARITLKGKPPAEINVLDFFGVPTGRKVKPAGASFKIDGTHRTYYYEVKR
jgi:hypothetical protein